MESDSEMEPDYEVEAILQCDVCQSDDGGKMIAYRVRWKGYADLTWEPLQNLGGCFELLKAHINDTLFSTWQTLASFEHTDLHALFYSAILHEMGHKWVRSRKGWIYDHNMFHRVVIRDVSGHRVLVHRVGEIEDYDRWKPKVYVIPNTVIPNPKQLDNFNI